MRILVDMGGHIAMNLPPTAVLIFFLIAAVANIVVLLAVFARHRAERSRQLVDVGGFMSSSYAGEPARTEEPEQIAGGWLPPSEGWSAARGTAWPEASETLEEAEAAAAAEAAAELAADADPADPSAVEPFAYPEPTTLEQRSIVAEATEDDAWDDDLDDIDDADTADEVGAVGAIEEVGATESEPGPRPEQEDEPVMEPSPTMTDDTVSAEADAAPTLGPVHTNGTVSVRGRDALTGMLDATAFEDVMAQEDAREQRYGRPATVIVFELDGLTKLVDRLGPEPGDRIETALGDSIKRLARRADHVARLERGRYAVLLPETDEVAAINYVERIRRACELWLESGAIAMRLSIGWASSGGDAGLHGALRVATDRMRAELRRNSRTVGDVVPDLELIEGDGEADGEPEAEAAAGL